MKILANIISTLGHPLILIGLLLILTYSIDSYSYYLDGKNAIGAFLITSFFLLILFPVVGIGMLAGLKMISSIQMPKREDRIGPLIITLSFYIWYFINVKDNFAMPDTLKMVALGAVLAVGLGFFINNFFKVSLHAIGASSAVVSFLIMVLILDKAQFDLVLPYLGNIRLSSIFVLLVFTVFAGLIGASRLYLKAHTSIEVYTGYLVGVLAQVLAFRIII